MAGWKGKTAAFIITGNDEGIGFERALSVCNAFGGLGDKACCQEGRTHEQRILLQLFVFADETGDGHTCGYSNPQCGGRRSVQLQVFVLETGFVFVD